MKANFKPLALSAAVAAATAGSAAVYAQDAGVLPTLGDFAVVPYYTVQEDWVTGVHIVNTSAQTVAVKFRMRRYTDSDDVLDFNLVLSPFDVWTGTVRGDDTAMEVATEDGSCAAPVILTNSGIAPVQIIEDAQEGYIEVIAMGATADESQPAAVAALHDSDGVPADCNSVEANFRVANLDPDAQVTDSPDGSTAWIDAGNVLKVSYFIRDNASGIEFGNNAVHIADFSTGSLGMMSHQQYGVESYSVFGALTLDGWDFPDINGGGCGYDGATCAFSTGDYRGRFDAAVRPALGAEALINEWSYNAETGAATDWVVTFPGQYNMIDIWAPAPQQLKGGTANFTEIPVEAQFSVYDREEQGAIPGGLGFSPSPAPDVAVLPFEVNVVTWGNEAPVVLDSADPVNADPAAAGIEAPYGWAMLEVEPTGATGWRSCDHAIGPDAFAGTTTATRCVAVTNTAVPMVGFTAWQRTFADASKNYGRIVEHAFIGSGGAASAPTP